MKKAYLLFFLCCLGYTNFATTWYSAPAGGDPSIFTSWWNSPAGTGANPPNFTTVTDSFIVQSDMTMTAAAWTVSAIVIVEGGDIRLASTTTAPIITFNGITIIDNGFIWDSRAGGGGFGGGGGSPITLNFRAPLTMNNNSSIDGDPAASGGAITVNIYSDFTMTGTSFFNNQSSSFSAINAVNFAGTGGSLINPQHISSTGSQAGSDWTTFTVANGAFVQLVDNFNTEPTNTMNNNWFAVANGGTLDCQGFNFNGPGEVVMGSTTGQGGTLYTSNTAGINGSIQCTGTNAITGGSNYVFNGTSPQVTGTLLPASFSYTPTGGGGGFGGGGGPYAGTMTVKNAAGVTLSQTTTFPTVTTGGGFGGGSVSASLILTSGTLTLGADNLIMGSGATITGPFSNTAMVVTNGAGQLQKQFAANASFLYPVGGASGNYTPITLSMTGTAYSGTAEAGVTVFNTKDPHNANTTDYLNRYWNIVLTGITTPSYTITSAQYVPGDVVGVETDISGGKYPAALPWVKYAAANTAAHTLSSTAITNNNIDFSGITTAAPAVTVTPSAVVCSGAANTLAVLTSTADAPPTYTWAPSSGLSFTAGTSVVATPTTTTTYTLTVTDGNGFKGTATTTLTVNPAPGPITGAGAGAICLGQTFAFSDATGGGVWSSSNSASASVDGSGNVTALSVGTPTISYTIGGLCAATVDLSVLSSAPAITGGPNACTGAVTALSDIGSGTWSSSNPAQATIDPVTGALTGVSPGGTVVTYTLAPGCTATSSITVISSPSPIGGSPNACIGVSSPLSESTLGGAWSSSNTAFATVSPTGGVTGVAAGSAVISYSLSGCSVIHPMGVIALPPVITGTTTVCAGFSTTLSDAISGGTWSTGNPALATVNPLTGAATGVSPGFPTITYTLLPGCSTSVPLTVNSSGTPAEAISIAPGETVCPGTMVYFTTTSTSFAGTTPTFEWIKNGLPVGSGLTFHYVPANGDVVYNVMHSTFTCRTMDSAFSNLIPITVTPSVTPVVAISGVSAFVGMGENDTLVANVTSASATPAYQWYKNSILIPGATMSFYVVNEAVTGHNDYNCIVYSGDACNTEGVSNTFSVTITDVSVKQTAAAGTELTLAPNPSKGVFTMKLQSGINEPVNVVITNILGEKVKELTTTTNATTEISLGEAAGIYQLSASTDHGRYVARVVVN